MKKYPEQKKTKMRIREVIVIAFIALFAMTGCSGELFESLTTEAVPEIAGETAKDATLQDTVFSQSISAQGGNSVTITPAGNGDYEIWFAPEGTVAFVAGPTMTMTSGDSAEITAPADEGEYRLYIVYPDGTVSAPSTAVLTVDNTPPSVTVNQSSGQSDPATVLPVAFTIVFSEAVTADSFTADDLTDTGTASDVSFDAPVSSDNITWTVKAVSASGQGTIVPAISAGKVTDGAGNSNIASTSTDNSVTYNPPLTVTVNQASGQDDPVNSLPVEFTVVFSREIDDSTFASEDITNSGTANVTVWNITNSGDDITFTLKATTVSTTGTIIPSLAAGVAEDSGAVTNEASTSSDNSVTYTLVKPNVTIEQKGGQSDPVNTTPIEFDVVFSIPINPSTFETSDISGTGSASGITWDLINSGDDMNFTLRANAVTGDGTVVPEIDAGKVESLAGNTNNASTATDNSVTYDTTAPTALLSGEPTGTNNVETLNVDVSGTDVAAYRHWVGVAANCNGITIGSYGTETDVGTNITDDLSSYDTGSYDLSLCVIGKDTAGNWQSVGTSATEATWTKDNSAINVTLSGAPTGTNNTTSLNIAVTASGSETHYIYDLVNGTDCSSASYGSNVAIATNITDDISGLSDSSVTVCVKGYLNPSYQATPTSATWVKDTSPPTVSSAQTLDLDGDGKIDHYKITFTESVDDSTFPGYNSGSPVATADWQLGPGASDYTNETLDLSVSGDAANDSVIYLAYDEISGTCNETDQTGCNTGSKPDLTMINTGLKDIYGNTVALIGTGDVTESDGAPPIVVGAYPYSNITVNLYYSENVTAASSECSDSATCASIYEISPSLTVNEADLQADQKIVVLSVDTQTQSESYTITSFESVVRDVSNLSVYSPYNTASFSGAAPETTLISAQSIDNTTVVLTFNLDVTSASAEISSKYSIPGLTVNDANMYPTPGSDGTTVRLTTSSHLSNTEDGYTVTVSDGSVSGVSSGTCDSPNNTASFTGDTLPAVETVSSTSLTEIDLSFSEDVSWATTGTGALNKDNYCIETLATASSDCSGTTLAVSSVASVNAQNKVRITAASQSEGTVYRVTVQNVVDTTTPSGNTISSTGNYGNFTGGENIKVLQVRRVLDDSSSFNVFKVVFSKPFKIDGGSNAVNNLSNWDFGDLDGGTYSTTVCTSADDSACPISYTEGTDNVIYFKVAPEPGLGAHTIVAATAAGSPSGAAGCILPSGGTSPDDCLRSNPDDRGTVDFGLPIVIEDGPVYTDPFNDAATLSGQVLKYNGKLLIGPNDTDSGLFMTDINLGNSVSIFLDSDDEVSGNQEFNNTGNGISGTKADIDGIDYMYAACIDGDSDNPELTGTACTNDNGREYLSILGYTAQTNGVYETAWFSDNTVSPFVFDRIDGLSAYGGGGRTLRAMSIRYFKGWMYYATQHNYGSYPPRTTMFSVTPGGSPVAELHPDVSSDGDMAWRYITRVGDGGDIRNGQYDAVFNPGNNSIETGLVSIDYMYEYDYDGADSNVSQLYLANGGSCNNETAPNRCLEDKVRNSTTQSDGGIVRTALAYSTTSNAPGFCSNNSDCNTYFEDVTPSLDEWNMYMSKPLPQIALTGEDWTYLKPTNAITPSIKAIPKMVEYNGDLYIIRNACATTNYQYVLKGTVSASSGTAILSGNNTYFTKQRAGINTGETICVNTSPVQCRTVLSVADNTSLTVDSNWTSDIPAGTKASMGNFFDDADVCPSGEERPQLWRLPECTGDCSAATARGRWEFIGEGTTYTTRMSGATWIDGSDQSTKTGNNIHITLLVVNGDKLYVGFDNHENGLNVWRTKSGVTAPSSESDFEAVCQTGNNCFTSSKQFGWGSTTDTKIFDGISVNDAGTDYVIFTSRSGTHPMRIYRTSNQ